MNSFLYTLLKENIIYKVLASSKMNLQLFADFLSVFTVGMCFVQKIPQIINLFSTKTASQISLLSLLLELTSYTVMTSYNYTNNYSLLSYMEYPVILLQECILIYLVLVYTKRLHTTTWIIIAIYLTLSTCFLMEIIPKTVLLLLTPMCTPISASSKVMQLLVILKAKNADSVSPVTWFISALTNLTRVFTVWVESGDLLLLANFMISVLLSSSVMCSSLYYRHHVSKED